MRQSVGGHVVSARPGVVEVRSHGRQSGIRRTSGRLAVSVGAKYQGLCPARPALNQKRYTQGQSGMIPTPGGVRPLASVRRPSHKLRP